MGLKVIIIGAGSAGPVMALYLKKAGHTPVLYDMFDPFDTNREPGLPLFFGDIGGAIAMQTNGQRVLDYIGLLDKVLEKSSEPFDNALFAKIDGSSPVDVSNFQSSRVTPGANRDKYTTVTLMRMHLQWTVASACNSAGISYVLGSKLLRVEETESGVKAYFANGSVATGDILIGADGVHSATRMSVFGSEYREVFANTIHHIGVTELGKEKGVNGEDLYLDHIAGFYNDRITNHAMIFLRTAPTNTAWQVIEVNVPAPAGDLDEKWRPVPDLPAHAKRLAVLVDSWGAAKNHVEIVRAARRVTASPIYVVPRMPSFSKGRVILIGDAAHAMLPHLGQGTNIALEDVGTLGLLMAEFGDDWKKAFKLYDEIRSPRIKFVSDQSNMVKGMDNATYGHLVVKVMAFASKHLGYLDKIASYDFKGEVDKVISKYRK
ncbi:hypothetical protein HDU83_001378 [Entophlyctis luteolus]|nr:hypothetical protein HDU82_008211 [Entophlyctis luteolus]KAJ3348362.1 hypothetical protein HDU83_001378 [Entophlyctis luteolus]KAJ3381784.1 hypothetical protein HDU84_004857 [Entophlyctis sp. JEL0112]